MGRISFIEERGNKFFRFVDRYLGVGFLLFLSWLRKRGAKPHLQIHQIAVVEPAAIGDTIILTPVLRALRNNFPKAYITFICSRGNYEVVKHIPYIDKIEIFDVQKFLGNPFRFFKWLESLRQKQFDVVLDFEPWVRIPAIISALLRGRFKIGFKTAN